MAENKHMQQVDTPLTKNPNIVSLKGTLIICDPRDVIKTLKQQEMDNMPGQVSDQHRTERFTSMESLGLYNFLIYNRIERDHNNDPIIMNLGSIKQGELEPDSGLLFISTVEQIKEQYNPYFDETNLPNCIKIHEFDGVVGVGDGGYIVAKDRNLGKSFTGRPMFASEIEARKSEAPLRHVSEILNEYIGDIYKKDTNDEFEY